MSTVFDSLNQLKEMGLLTDDDLSICGQIVEGEDPSVDSVIDLLVDQGRLTKFQAGMIQKRRPDKLIIGDYVVLDKLGAGGMGVVYKAVDRRMHREVAIKMLLESGQQSEEKIERFRREAIAAARMNHPNIVTAYTASDHEGYPYLVMEYVKGRDLASVVKKGDTLPIPEAVNYMLQSAVGMAYAHSRHIIHRDLKPSNLLLAAPDDTDIRPNQYAQVKILDMGLARLTQPGGEVISPIVDGSDLSATGMLMGTVDYMAPEQAMDTKRADHRSDIYSLGCTLYFLLTKKPVYTGNNLLERISAHLKTPIPSLKEARPEVSGELDAIFQKMVAKKPRDRYQSMMEVVEALGKIDRQFSGLDSSPSHWSGNIPGSSPGAGVEFAQPGSSYGTKSGSGSQGSAPTIASGSGPVPGVAGSSYGSTSYGGEFATGGTFVRPGTTPLQRGLVVGLVLLMAGTMGAIYYKLKMKPPVIEHETIVEGDPKPVPVVPPARPPIYLPRFCRAVAGESKEVEVAIHGKKYRCYDVIALNAALLPNWPNPNLGPEAPAIAEKPAVRKPAIAQKPGQSFIPGELWVRFRLIPEDEHAKLRPFYIMETKVWNDLFRAFAENHPQRTTETAWAKTAKGNLPAFNVSLMEAYWCARWMGGELPSGKEWDTAAGFFLPPDDRGDRPGPYRLPEKEGDPLRVAVYGQPEAVDAPTDDVGPFQIQGMAGNGEEFTRTTKSGSDLNQAVNPIDSESMVILRGLSFDQLDPLPLTYLMMQEFLVGRIPWGTGNESSSVRGFRVVLEIPGK